jgi:hypothetical protein
MKPLLEHCWAKIQLVLRFHWLTLTGSLVLLNTLYLPEVEVEVEAHTVGLPQEVEVLVDIRLAIYNL